MRDFGWLFVVLALFVLGGLYWVSRKIGVDIEVVADVVLRAGLVVLGSAGLAWARLAWKVWAPWQIIFPGLWVAIWPILRAKGARLPEFMLDRGFEPDYEWFAQGWFLWGGLVILVALAAWWWWSDRDI